MPRHMFVAIGLARPEQPLQGIFHCVGILNGLGGWHDQIESDDTRVDCIIAFITVF